MPILVKHSGNAAPTAYGAFGGGQGRRYAEDAKDAVNRIEADRQRGFQANQANLDRFYRHVESAANRRFQSEQSKLGYEQQSGENALNREFQADQGELGFKRQSGENALNRRFQEEQSGLGYQHQESMFERQAALNREFREGDWKRRREEFSFELTERQRQEDNTLADSLADVANSPDYTAEEKRNFSQRINERRANIQPVARRPKSGQLGPNGMPIGEVFNRNGWTFAVTDKGVERIGEDPTVLSGKDLAGVYAQATALAENEETGVVDQAKVDAYVKKFIDMHTQVVSGKFGKEEAKPGATPPPTTMGDVDDALSTAQHEIANATRDKGDGRASVVKPTSARDAIRAVANPRTPDNPFATRSAPPPTRGAPISAPAKAPAPTPAKTAAPAPVVPPPPPGGNSASDGKGGVAPFNEGGDQGIETRVTKDGRVVRVRKTANGKYEVLGEVSQARQ
jgi:hypothetical protein